MRRWRWLIGSAVFSRPTGFLSGVGARVKRYRTEFEEGLRAYVQMRGYSSLHDRKFFVRAFLECWAEPGFHRFWRIWNPGISYFVFKLYCRLRVSFKRDSATILAFVANGFAHNAVACPLIGRWSWTLPAAFLSFGAFTVVSRRLDGLLGQDRWPWPLNAVVNVGLVCLSMDLGFRFNAWVG
jgi:hypothetical protein